MVWVIELMSKRVEFMRYAPTIKYSSVASELSLSRYGLGPKAVHMSLENDGFLWT
jgi:hypothetical protein